MMRMVAPVALMLTLVSASAAGEQVLLRPSDFAYGISIQTTATAGPLFEVPLPRVVYETVTRADLGDLRVFNARGEVVPYALRPPEAQKLPVEWTRLSFFPVRASNKRSPDELALRIQKNKAGSILSVQAGTVAGSGAPVVFYLVDASADDRPIRALELNWKDVSAAGFSGSLRVEAGDDLKQWRILASEAPLARLRYQGQLLERRRIEFAPVQAKYLRLVWLRPERMVTLSEVKAERLTGPVPPPREWATAKAVGRGAHPGEYLYRLAGHVPVDRARVRMPRVNTVTAVDLLSRANGTASWRERAKGLVYRLSLNGNEVTGDDVSFSPDADGDREWQLRFSPRDAGPGPDVPGLELGWIPQQLVFVALGEGPFLLAYGSAGMPPGENGTERLLQSAGREAEPFRVPPASLGAPSALGGSERLQVPFTPRPWRKWLLWLAVALGVFLLGLMASRRARP
jgi:hypothetical protein